MGMENNMMTGKASFRVRKIKEMMLKPKVNYEDIEPTGLENLEEIPPDAQVIVMSTHRDDTDMFLAKHVLEKRFPDIVTMNKSTHHKFLGKPRDKKSYWALRLAGKKNFLPVDYNYKQKADGTEEEKSSPGMFNPDNFARAAEMLKKRKTVLIAAHNPTYDPTQSLDEINGGYGGVYLASLTDAWILPITVVLDKTTKVSKENPKPTSPQGKANASVSIGKPFKLERIEGIERFSELLKKGGAALSTEEKAEFSRLADALRARSKIVMEKMSAQLKTQNL